jgi:predicted nucleic acid-binding protein
LYLALAIELDGRMVTADQRLYNSVSATPLANRIVWVADFAKAP